jgi:hypothetical protein
MVPCVRNIVLSQSVERDLFASILQDRSRIDHKSPVIANQTACSVRNLTFGLTIPARRLCQSRGWYSRHCHEVVK